MGAYFKVSKKGLIYEKRFNEKKLMEYLQSEDEDTHNKRLNRYMENTKEMQPHINNNMLGMVVHSIIMNRLRGKAEEENKRNKVHHARMFENYKNKEFNEKVYLTKMAHDLELAKEDRHNKRDLEKERRMHEHDMAKALTHAKISDIYKQKDEGRKAIQGSFADPGDALRYMSDPEAMEKKREVFDDSGLKHKIWGKVKEAFGGEKYQPKKIKSRLKE